MMNAAEYTLCRTSRYGDTISVATFARLEDIVSFANANPCNPKYNDYFIQKAETSYTRLSMKTANEMVKQ